MTPFFSGHPGLFPLGHCIEKEEEVSEAPSLEEFPMRGQKMGTSNIEETGPPSYLTDL